ncbi:hypothetical protein [Lysinibacillus fusiformis]|uniref:hypothetical protein n=1 Tax=Lysinibacillus fusiformis TaxID=28031 RepID=UPI00148E7398|nr:hypothetical protein [Lysinibacillus fusiformis]NOG28547.1 hypothetical protein [Lysinibacillus fusiformis]
MTLKDKLLQESRNAIEDYALIFACNVEPRLAEEACGGRTEYIVSIDIKDIPIFTSPIFINTVNELLDGVKAEIIELPVSSFFPGIQKSYLRLSWGDLSD